MTEIKLAELRKTLEKGKISGKLVLVKWVDSHYRAGWTTSEPETAPLMIISTGWVIAESETALTISSHISIEENPQRCGEMVIPKCAIVIMTYIL